MQERRTTQACRYFHPAALFSFDLSFNIHVGEWRKVAGCLSDCSCAHFEFQDKKKNLIGYQQIFKRFNIKHWATSLSRWSWMQSIKLVFLPSVALCCIKPRTLLTVACINQYFNKSADQKSSGAKSFCSKPCFCFLYSSPSLRYCCPSALLLWPFSLVFSFFFTRKKVLTKMADVLLGNTEKIGII